MIKSPGQPLLASQTPTIGDLHGRSESTWRSVRVLLIDDHELFAQSVQQRFARAAPEQQFRFEHVTRLHGRGNALDRVGEPWHYIFVDLNLPDSKGLNTLIAVIANRKSSAGSAAGKVVVLSGLDEPARIRDAWRFGASGFIPKSLDAEAFDEALRGLLRNGRWFPMSAVRPTADNELAPQMRRVLQLLAASMSLKEIARAMDISEDTVKTHKKRLFERFAAGDTVELLKAARSHGFVD
ncbi:MAG: LuxR C-terminal-related transcriptional regulator [Betaproteobacteria bacterium]|jgi:DNA-binding NarL/FixJ family response regulator